LEEKPQKLSQLKSFHWPSVICCRDFYHEADERLIEDASNEV